MKIAFITSMKYGLTQFIFRDIEALVGKGHQVRIFTLLNNEGLYNPLPDWNIISISLWRTVAMQFLFFIRQPQLYLNLLRNAVRTRSISNFVIAVSFVDKMRDVDVIYSYFGDHKLYTGYYCKRITRIPLLVTIRAYELYQNPNPEIFVEALRACDQIVTITEYNRNILHKTYGIPLHKVDIVRQIVDLENYKDIPKIKILIVGFFAEKKGHEVLFRAIRQMNRKDIELWVVGEVTPTIVGVDCRKIVRELGIESQVAFFGAQTGVALRAFYRECDIFCLPSRTDHKGDREGFPNVIAEAMAFGKPIVSTRHTGIPEALDAILVEENNVEQLAEALNMICESVELRRQLGEKNRKVAEAMFSPANTEKLEKILSLYAKPHEPNYPTQLEIYREDIKLHDEKSYK